MDDVTLCISSGIVLALWEAVAALWLCKFATVKRADGGMLSDIVGVDILAGDFMQMLGKLRLYAGEDLSVCLN